MCVRFMLITVNGGNMFIVCDCAGTVTGLGLVYIKTSLFEDGAIATDSLLYSPRLH